MDRVLKNTCFKIYDIDIVKKLDKICSFDHANCLITNNLIVVPPAWWKHKVNIVSKIYIFWFVSSSKSLLIIINK